MRPAGAPQPTLSSRGSVGAALSHPRAPAVVMAGIMAAAFLLLMYLDRGIGFFYDEWTFVLDRRGHDLGTFLKPHNEHIVVAPVIAYKTLFAVAGLGHHWPYFLVLVAMHLLLGLGVYLLVRPRAGAWPAVMAATLILFAGLAWQNMIWAFQIGFVGSVLGGVWAWVALDRGGRRSGLAACLALLFATVSSSLGVPMALGVAAELLVQGRKRAIWVGAVPLGLYVLWYLGYGVSTITAQGLVHAAPWAVTAVAAAAGALFGLGTSWGTALVVIGVIALGWRLAAAPPTPRLVGILVAGIAFWALSGAARSVFQPPVPPDSSRYLTFGAVVLLLAAVELAAGVVVPPRLLALGGAITLLAVALGLPVLRDNAVLLRTQSGTTDAELGAMQLVQRSVPADYRPDPPVAPPLLAGGYFAATRSYGTVGDSPAELLTDLSSERVQADRVLQEVVAHLVPASARPSGTPPALEQAIGASPTARGPCTVVRARAAPTVVAAVVPRGGLLVRAEGRKEVEVRLRRFGDAFANPPVGSVAPGAPQLLRLPADASSQPYRVQLAGRTGLAVCSV
jgi:hypothetical protein